MKYKWDTCAVDQVSVDYDQNGDGILEEPLQTVVHDRQDRKWWPRHSMLWRLTESPTIAFAGDTDWHGWKPQLEAVGLCLEPIIEVV